jgi:hypothetical protein
MVLMLPIAIFNHNGLDAFQVKQVRQHQAGGPRPDNTDLCPDLPHNIGYFKAAIDFSMLMLFFFRVTPSA